MCPLPHPTTQQDYSHGIGYFNQDGKYGYFWSKPSRALAEKNESRVLALSDSEGFNGAVRK